MDNDSGDRVSFDPPEGAVATPSAFERGELYGLSHGGWELLVDPLRGARICSFSLNGANVLTGPDVDPNNWGSTFWTSPQSDWHWPPVFEVDAGPYAVVDCDSSFLCAGSLSSQLGILVTKRFSVDPARDCACVEYTMSNQSSDTLRLAPWEISRVPGGLTFFEVGEGKPVESPLPEPTLVERRGIVWFEYQREAIAQDQKVFLHSHAGWLAHVVGEMVLIKQFEPIAASKQAPGEAMIELFASGEKDYIEIEQQGAYSKIGPWKDHVWRVHWYLREAPRGVDLRLGNDELTDWVRSVVS